MSWSFFFVVASQNTYEYKMMVMYYNWLVLFFITTVKTPHHTGHGAVDQRQQVSLCLLPMVALRPSCFVQQLARMWCIRFDFSIQRGEIFTELVVKHNKPEETFTLMTRRFMVSVQVFEVWNCSLPVLFGPALADRQPDPDASFLPSCTPTPRRCSARSVTLC